MPKIISARVNVRTVRPTNPNKPRFSILTDITIRAAVWTVNGDKKKLDLVTVATRTIPGKWTEAAAITEFKKNPKPFTFEAGFTEETFRHAA